MSFNLIPYLCNLHRLRRNQWLSPSELEKLQENKLKTLIHHAWKICDNVIVEFIKEDGTKAKNGEEGEIVVTSLHSYTMLFIRYKLGDIGIFSDERCPCGRGLPLMKMVRGRVNDYIILPNGKKISPYRLMITMDKISEVKRYQIIQEMEKKIKINIVQSEAVSDETISKIAKGYKEILNEYIDIEVKVVKDIPVEKTGKFKVIFSKISDNNDTYI